LERGDGFSRLVLVVAIGWTAFVVVSAVVVLASYDLPKSLNEIGDSLSGFASALALGWLVAGFFLQHRELAATRKEYREMRELHARDSCLKSTRLFLESLENSVASFESLFRLVTKHVYGEDVREAPPLYGYGYLAKCCGEIDRLDQAETKAKFEPFVEPLRREVRRFVMVYEKMLSYLDDDPEGGLVRKAVVDASAYADVMRRIDEASRAGGLSARVFDLGDVT